MRRHDNFYNRAAFKYVAPDVAPEFLLNLLKIENQCKSLEYMVPATRFELVTP
jgi:hypothetical protein